MAEGPAKIERPLLSVSVRRTGSAGYSNTVVAKNLVTPTCVSVKGSHTINGSENDGANIPSRNRTMPEESQMTGRGNGKV